MKITLSQNEIEQAVRSYMEGIITLKPDTQMTCEFTNGRGPNGISVEINIESKAAEKPQEKPFPSSPIVDEEDDKVPFEATAEPQNVHSLFGNLN